MEYSFILALMERFTDFSEITRRALLHTARRFHVRLKQSDMDVLGRAWAELPLYPDVMDALETLSRRYTLTILSNGDRDLLGRLLHRRHVAHLFSDVLSAEEVATYKPSPRVYQLAVTRLGLPPEEVGLVSSNVFDVMGAKAAGLRAIWVRRGDASLDPLDLEPDLKVRDFEELAQRL